MLVAAWRGHFDTIVCWKSDRLSRGMYAAALLEVVEAQAHQIRLEAVMDAIGKIELDNYRERSTLRKRGTAKQGRACTPAASPTDTALETIDDQAEVVRRTFQMYVDEGMGSYSIAVLPTDEGITTQTGKLLWLQSRFHHSLGNATYTGSWVYGNYRHVSTENGVKVYDQPWDTWIEIPMPHRTSPSGERLRRFRRPPACPRVSLNDKSGAFYKLKEPTALAKIGHARSQKFDFVVGLLPRHLYPCWQMKANTR